MSRHILPRCYRLRPTGRLRRFKVFFLAAKRRWARTSAKRIRDDAVPPKLTPEENAAVYPLCRGLPSASTLPLPQYWSIDLTASTPLMLGLSGSFPPRFCRVSHYHVTLLYAGGLRCETAYARYGGTMSRQRFEKMVLKCKRWEGREVSVPLERVVQDDQLACVKVGQLPKGCPCLNRHPHVTLGHVPEVRPVYSNTLLASEHLFPGVRARELGSPAPRACGVVRATFRR